MTGQLFVSLVLFATVARCQASRDHIERWADHWASEYRVPRELVHAVIQVESDWQAFAVSTKGAVGPMQLLPATASRFGVANRFDVTENTRAGVAYLAHLLRKFGGDWRLALAGYYTGEGRVTARGLRLADPDVTRYVLAVRRAYRRMCLAQDATRGDRRK